MGLFYALCTQEAVTDFVLVVCIRHSSLLDWKDHLREITARGHRGEGESTTA
jgi:hypothetical protein